ncbi:hypothetical protein [Sorangium atrum]|uniref:Uncharacterized protein n=1 Tax=Sorangium atrum TaxID=2995308 RepID=A0ABT5CH50_9BACT|nr:hypothetical protein [Sorangium aterium]MDC0685768.1 hypothetical protein [Sorangium aterium]
MAGDGMALAHLHEEHAGALRGKHPFTWEELELLREAGEWLLDDLTPDGARLPAAKQRGEAEAMRGPRPASRTLRRLPRRRALSKNQLLCSTLWRWHHCQQNDKRSRLAGRSAMAHALDGATRVRGRVLDWDAYTK